MPGQWSTFNLNHSYLSTFSYPKGYNKTVCLVFISAKLNLILNKISLKRDNCFFLLTGLTSFTIQSRSFSETDRQTDIENERERERERKKEKERMRETRRQFTD